MAQSRGGRESELETRGPMGPCFQRTSGKFYDVTPP
jgi:hypothetical protein